MTVHEPVYVTSAQAVGTTGDSVTVTYDAKAVWFLPSAERVPVNAHAAELAYVLGDSGALYMAVPEVSARHNAPLHWQRTDMRPDSLTLYRARELERQARWGEWQTDRRHRTHDHAQTT